MLLSSTVHHLYCQIYCQITASGHLQVDIHLIIRAQIIMAEILIKSKKWSLCITHESMQLVNKQMHMD